MIEFVVNEVIPIDYSPDSVRELGRFATMDEAVTVARAYVPSPGRHDDTPFARIEIEGWKT
jgi:hypothetical protein